MTKLPGTEIDMRAITAAARFVKSRLPRDHGFDLAELVSIGAERVLRYLASRDPPAPGWLVFITAKQGMIHEARRWQGRSRHGHTRTFSDPTFCTYEEDLDDWQSQRCVPMPPIEAMIDAKRALLGMRLREAVAWYSHHWLCQDLSHLEGELGVSESRIAQYCRAARDKLEAAWSGDRHATESEISVRREARRVARDAGRATRQQAANECMLAERRRRYAELRALGASSADAARVQGSTARYEALLRELGGFAERAAAPAKRGSVNASVAVDDEPLPSRPVRLARTVKHRETRQRYNELRGRGASVAMAKKGCKGPGAFATAVRVLDAQRRDIPVAAE